MRALATMTVDPGVPHLRSRDLPATRRRSQLLQERSAPVLGNGLRGTEQLHSGPAAERLRHRPPETAIAEENCHPAYHLGGCDIGDPLFRPVATLRSAAWL